jgi:endonuclease YncB( thermonuclease family)
MRSLQSSILLSALLMIGVCVAPTLSEGAPRTRVNLNGKDYPVYFNDGDSFRVLSGDLKDTKARLAGFNTLESYGPVHSWGTWTKKELYVVAKMGTYNGREGVWTCTSDLSKDTYGRILWRCPGLSEDQIKKGLAHAMSITPEPADARDVKAQRYAVKNKRGMWAHGVPEYVLTSIHSVDERSGDRPAYNRLVSSVDGHSLKWEHRDQYEECQDVCWRPTESDRVRRFADRLMKRPAMTEIAPGYTQEERDQLVKAYLKGDRALAEVTLKEDAHRQPLLKTLAEMDDQGWVEAALSEVETCMLYVDFRRRFGAARAVCLK